MVRKTTTTTTTNKQTKKRKKGHAIFVDAPDLGARQVENNARERDFRSSVQILTDSIKTQNQFKSAFIYSFQTLFATA